MTLEKKPGKVLISAMHLGIVPIKSRKKKIFGVITVFINTCKV